MQNEQATMFKGVEYEAGGMLVLHLWGSGKEVVKNFIRWFRKKRSKEKRTKEPCMEEIV